MKPYDFKTANRFPKEQIRTISIVMGSFMQLLSNYLTGILRVNCEVEALPIEELTFYEFNNALPSPAILAILTAPPMEGSLMMQMSSEVSDAIVSRLLGGVSATEENKKRSPRLNLRYLRELSDRC